ncbi:MAG: EAL domain-containing protein [Acidiferrobacterales bacterium]
MGALPSFSLRVRLLLLILCILLPTGGLLVHTAIVQRQLATAGVQHKVKRLVEAVSFEQTQLVTTTRQLLLGLTQLRDLRQPRIPGGCNTLLAGLLKTQPYYLNLVVASISGQVLCSADRMTGPVNVADHAFFRRTMETRTFAVGDYQIGRITHRGTINFAAPVFGHNGKITRVVFVAVDLSWLNRLIGKTRLPQGSTITLIDSHGTILARHPDPARWTGKLLANPLLLQALREQKRAGTDDFTNVNGANRLYDIAPLGISAADDVYLIIGIPRVAAYAPVNHAFFENLLIFGAVAFLGIATAWIGGYVLFVRKVNAISHAARQLALGDMSTRTGLPHGPGEFGQVARGFDEMAEKLQRHQSELDSANRELKQINRALITLSSCNRTLVRAVDEKSLLQGMCRVIVEIGGYRMAWVGTAENDKNLGIRPIAHAGFEEGYLETLNVSWADNERGRGPAGTAIRTNAPSISRNLVIDARFGPWRAEAVKRGYASCIGLPLCVSGKTTGTLVIYSVDADAFGPAEVDLLVELTDDLAFGIETLRTRDQSKLSQETIWTMAYYDKITGLPNHARLAEFIQQMLVDAPPDNDSFALLLLDIDRFRDVNDALGIQQANSLLQAIGLRLRRMLPESELLAHMRGDEFAILLPRSDAAHAIQTARHLSEAMEDPFMMNDLSLDVRVSIGIVLYPEHGDKVDLLMRRADIAVRRAQKSTSGFAVYTAEQDDDSPRRLALATDLRQAIDSNQLLQFYQPKIDMKTGHICGVEALARWNHPQHGAVTPDEFIRLAEHTGLIHTLTHRVLETAVRQARAWRDIGRPVPIAANLSAFNLRDAGLVGKIESLVAAWGIEYDQLELEITETAIMEDPVGALDVLTRLGALGISLSVDDFGTGYSSLSYLHKLPVDSIKIDKSFVMPMLSDKDSAVIVRSTIALAHDLGLKVIAEGVENEASWLHLSELGCDVAQGYYIARPMPAAEFECWYQDYLNLDASYNRGRST